MTAEYAIALEASRAAAAKYMEARKAFYAGLIDDATFLSAQREDKIAAAAFDTAYANEAVIA